MARAAISVAMTATYLEVLFTRHSDDVFKFSERHGVIVRFFLWLCVGGSLRVVAGEDVVSAIKKIACYERKTPAMA